MYEPEFRLYPISFGLFVGIPGLALFGWYASTATVEHKVNWIVISFLYGMIIFTTVTQQSTSFAYLLDAHRNISIETAVFVVMARNFFSFAAGKFLPVWLAKEGTAKTFYTIAGIQAALVLSTILMYMYGKVVRSFLSTHSPMRLFGTGSKTGNEAKGSTNNYSCCDRFFPSKPVNLDLRPIEVSS